MFRSESYARTAEWPYAGVPYSMDNLWSDGYRQDCSGFVSMLWGLPTSAPGSWGGFSTVTFITENVMYEISPSMLKRADAIANAGPDTAGAGGHIMWFEGWYIDANDGRCWIWEQAGGINGPRRRLINFPGAPYKAYRCRTIVDDPSGAVLQRPWPSYMGPNDYFGDINGPDNSHGGYYSYEQSDVKAIQQRLIALGYVAGISDIYSGWADGIFGPPTIASVAAWQRALYAAETTLYGEVWSDDWARLFTY